MDSCLPIQFLNERAIEPIDLHAFEAHVPGLGPEVVHASVIEMSFAAIERTLEFCALTTSNDSIDDFREGHDRAEDLFTAEINQSNPEIRS